jgi:hypothetical protein
VEDLRFILSTHFQCESCACVPASFTLVLEKLIVSDHPGIYWNDAEVQTTGFLLNLIHYICNKHRLLIYFAHNLKT